MNTDYIYWTFTAAAQCVSTFVALLLTGYALVLSQIEAARERDDSLQEIHAALRKSYHARLTGLAWMTAMAVGLSLLVVWINRSNEPTPASMLWLAGAMDAVAMIAGLAFVVAIIDPDKYQKAAERALEARSAGTEPRPGVPATEFFRAYRRLERQLRELRRRPDGDAADTTALRGASLSQLADALLQGETISDELHTDLSELARYRNLLFHGDLKLSDAPMVERVRALQARVRSVSPATTPRRQEGA